MRLLGLNDHDGLWSKKEEFWRNKPNGDFPGKMFIKETSYLVQQRYIFLEKVLNETSYKNRFMGKVLKDFFPFSTKI